MFYYFDDIIKIEDFDNILLGEKSYHNILIYISYKTLTDAKPLHIRFDKLNGFIRVYDGTSLLFDPEKYDAIYSRIRYLVSERSSYYICVSHNYAKTKIDSYDSLHLEH